MVVKSASNPNAYYTYDIFKKHPTEIRFGRVHFYSFMNQTMLNQISNAMGIRIKYGLICVSKKNDNKLFKIESNII